MAVRLGIAKFDAYGSPFIRYQYFPAVNRHKQETVRIVQLTYSSDAINGTKYRRIPLVGGHAPKSINVDEKMVEDPESMGTTMSSLVATQPTHDTYLSIQFEHKLGGASFGLALALAISGAEPVFSSGFIAGAGQDTDGAILPIDCLPAKLRFARNFEFPFYISSIMPEGILTTIDSTTPVYTFSNYLRAEPLRKTHQVVAVSNLSEALLIASQDQIRPYNRTSTSSIRD